MTVALKIRVRDLVPELLAHTLIVLDDLQTAGTVAVFLPEPLADEIDDFLILIESYRHDASPFAFAVWVFFLLTQLYCIRKRSSM